MHNYTILDVSLVPFYLLIIMLIAYRIRDANIERFPEFQYFVPGLMVKMFGALFFCFIYTFYYDGGDTLGYHQTAQALVNLLYDSPLKGLKVLAGSNTDETFSYFNYRTGFPVYWSDNYAFNLTRFISPLEILGLKSYPATTMLVACLGFSGVWTLYRMFVSKYPALRRELAYTALFIPSVVFWGSGILKDTFTVSAACWFAASFHGLFIAKRRMIWNGVAFAVSIYVMVSLKPYIFIAILPGAFIWGVWDNLKRIKSNFLRVLAGPLVGVAGLVIGAGTWLAVSDNLGQYADMESMLEKAVVTQRDLKREYYKGNSFDIGEFEATLPGVVSKFPAATVAGLFRPFIWEANNVLMFMSASENLLILIIALFALIRGPTFFFRALFTNPMLMFCMLFAVLFSFSVGLSTSNFGALVRFKIPAMPYFLSSLVVILYLRSERKQKKEDELDDLISRTHNPLMSNEEIPPVPQI